jgi:glycosyltransferase involved in cell wall biosynthesis
VNTSIPELSIIICGKQDSFELNTTLNSIIRQASCLHKLILILSNFSNEQLDEVQSKLSDKNFEIHLTEPRGIYSAMNLGLTVSNTKFVLFLNSGDELHSIENLNSLLDSIGDKNWGFGSIVKILPSLESIYFFKPYSRLFHRLGIKYVPHPATILNRELALSLNGFDEHYIIAADQKLLMQFGKIQAPVTAKAPITKFYLGGISSSRTHSEIVNDFRSISNEVYGKFFKNNTIDNYVWKLLTKLRQLFN